MLHLLLVMLPTIIVVLGNLLLRRHAMVRLLILAMVLKVLLVVRLGRPCLRRRLIIWELPSVVHRRRAAPSDDTQTGGGAPRPRAAFTSGPNETCPTLP